MDDDGDEVPAWVYDIGSTPSVVILGVGTLILFWGLSVVCEERFVPALSVICDAFGIPDDVAGATLMASGASSPEVFSCLISLFITHSSLGAGTIIGSEQFNLLGICAGSVFYAKGGRLQLDRKIVARESFFYLISLILLLLALTRESTIVRGQDNAVVRWPWALVLVATYSSYVFVCARFEMIVDFLDRITTTKLQDSPTELTAADSGVLERLKKNHVFSVENEPSSNFDDEFPSTRSALNASARSSYSSSGRQWSTSSLLQPASLGRRYSSTSSILPPAPLERLNTTAELISKKIGIVRQNLDEVVEDQDDLFACYLLRSSRFYSRSKISAKAWQPRWVVLQKSKKEFHSYVSRQDYDDPSVEFWSDNRGARRYKLVGFSAYDRSRGLVELSVDPIAKGTDTLVGQQQILYFLAPCKNTFELFLTHAEVISEEDEFDVGFNDGGGLELSRSSSAETTTLRPPDVDAQTRDNLGTYDEGGEAASVSHSLVAEPGKDASIFEIGAHYLLYPAKLALHLTVLDVRTRASPTGFDAVVACVQSVTWLAVMSFGMVACCETIGDIVGLSDSVIGLTFSAVGTSLPNLISSMVVASRGLGNMAVSNALGSNTFNILVGLGGPWLLFCLAFDGKYEGLPADDIVTPTLVLVATLFVFILLLFQSGFVLYRSHAFLFCFSYVVFLVWAIARETMGNSS